MAKAKMPMKKGGRMPMTATEKVLEAYEGIRYGHGGTMVALGDKPGHPFRGNQHGSSKGGGSRAVEGYGPGGPVGEHGETFDYPNGPPGGKRERIVARNLARDERLDPVEAMKVVAGQQTVGEARFATMYKKYGEERGEPYDLGAPGSKKRAEFVASHVGSMAPGDESARSVGPLKTGGAVTYPGQDGKPTTGTIEQMKVGYVTNERGPDLRSDIKRTDVTAVVKHESGRYDVLSVTHRGKEDRAEYSYEKKRNVGKRDDGELDVSLHSYSGGQERPYVVKSGPFKGETMMGAVRIKTGTVGAYREMDDGETAAIRKSGKGISYAL